MRRDVTGPLCLVLLLAAFGAFAWLTHHPEAALVERATRWPVVGPLAGAFRDHYLPAAPVEAATPEVEVVVLRPGRPPRPDAPTPSVPPAPRRTIWVPPGTPLHAGPDEASEISRRFSSYARLPWIERRDGWYRIERHRLLEGQLEGWIAERWVEQPRRDKLWRGEPVVPLAAREIDPAALAEARRLLGDASGERSCGPYRVLSDLADETFWRRCERLATDLDRLYGARYGLAPAGPARETLLLFAGAPAFAELRARFAPERRQAGFAAAARGFVAVDAAGRSDDEILATVVHELTHLLNRRFLGPALPPWIDEGLADDLGQSRIGADGALLAGSLGGSERGSRTHLTLEGAVASAARLRQSVALGGRLPLRLVTALDGDAFRAPGRAEFHYAVSSFWVRHLLSGDDPALAAGFRSFLAAVASGEPITEELLLDRLGRGWDALEESFADWLAALPRGGPRPAA